MDKVKLSNKLAVVNEHWRPKIVASLNGQEVKAGLLNTGNVKHPELTAPTGVTL